MRGATSSDVVAIINRTLYLADLAGDLGAYDRADQRAGRPARWPVFIAVQPIPTRLLLIIGEVSRQYRLLQRIDA